MPVELLRQLSEQTLPVTITDLADIDKLRVLRAAGQVACTMNATGWPSYGDHKGRARSTRP